MVRDVTTDWREQGNVGGLYVIRSGREGFGDRLRIGAGGNHGGARGLAGRLRLHGGARPKAPENLTLEYKPWRVLRAWTLEGWTASEINDGEHCLYRPFLIRFRRLVDQRRADSIFLVPVDADLAGLFAEAEHDLRRMEELRA